MTTPFSVTFPGLIADDVKEKSCLNRGLQKSKVYVGARCWSRGLSGGTMDHFSAGRLRVSSSEVEMKGRQICKKWQSGIYCFLHSHSPTSPLRIQPLCSHLQAATACLAEAHQIKKRKVTIGHPYCLEYCRILEILSHQHCNLSVCALRFFSPLGGVALCCPQSIV